MTPAEYDLLTIQLDRVEDVLGTVTAKEDIMLGMIENLQKDLLIPRQVVPVFGPAFYWLAGGFLVSTILSGLGILALAIL